MNNRRTTLIVAVVLAIGAGWLTLNYLSSLQRQSNANSAPRDVVVAAQDIPARVTITPQMLAHVLDANYNHSASRTENTMLKNMLSMLRNDDGATMVEYGIMVALIAAVCIVLIAALGGKVSTAFSTVNSAI